MSNLTWYWHRLRAMTPAEMFLHARKRVRQAADARRHGWDDVHMGAGSRFPALPDPSRAPAQVRAALANEATRILAGRWRAFGHLELEVDDPPRWHNDYLAGVDATTNTSAFKLNHRALPGGADVKLIWELSRWNELVRLAQAAYVLGDANAAAKCVQWLEDWVQHNPPYHGWNWTSALEAGLRLVQFTWLDALLATNAGAWNLDARLARLRDELLPAHASFTWRHRSFGSSANNHLIGELAGLILAVVRWPALQPFSAPLRLLQPLWEREVLRQFAEDGGHREQALNYHLFSLEFCWQTRQALRAAGRKVANSVEQRLVGAAGFFWNVQSNLEHWDYGDSDDAYVTPFFTTEKTRVAEWRSWLAGQRSPALDFWLGEFFSGARAPSFGPPFNAVEIGDWWFYPNSGMAVAESGFWWLRWDLSPLGYLATAAHGHLDALHLSVWFKGVAFVIDPGTGAYYADPDLRRWLSSRAAHNGPVRSGVEFPRRLGPFLWSTPHRTPLFGPSPMAVLNLPRVQLRRAVNVSPDHLRWTVDDATTGVSGRAGEFSVRWQFAPGTCVHRRDPRTFVLERLGTSLGVEVSEDWAEVHLVEQPGDRLAAGMRQGREGYVSPAFRKVEWAPCLALIARPQAGQSCVFRTTFVASAPR